MKRQSDRNLDEELKREYDHWNHIYTYGGQDPFYEDGYNLNLVRNHIISIKRQMEESGLIADTYYRDLPAEVDNKYMARTDEILENAKKSLETYKGNTDYMYLLDTIKMMNEHQIKDTSIRNVLGYVEGLRKYIASDRLVDMRRHENQSRYIESFTECRKRVEKILKINPRMIFADDSRQLQGQMSITDFIGG